MQAMDAKAQQVLPTCSFTGVNSPSCRASYAAGSCFSARLLPEEAANRVSNAVFSFPFSSNQSPITRPLSLGAVSA